MKLIIDTKYDIGQQVFFIESSTSHETTPCEHCSGNYREMVNGIEYTCPYCKGGRSSKTIQKFRARSGIITNVRISLLGIDRLRDCELSSDKKFDTNIRYCVTENRTENAFSDVDGNSVSKFEGQLYPTEEDARDAIEQEKIVTYTSR